MHQYRLPVLVALAGLLLALVTGLLPAQQALFVTTLAAQDPAGPRILLSGLHLPDGVRYSVALMRPPDLALRDLRVEVTLPADAEPVEALESPGHTQFLGNQDGTLVWTAPQFDAGEYLDAFTFALSRAPSTEFQVHVRWAGDPAGEASFIGQPAVENATVAAGELTLGAADIQRGGDTGVLVTAAPGRVPAGTRVQVRRLPPEANPPAAVGDLWWCALVEVAGLPAGAELFVLAPLRRPLPVGTEVALFRQDDQEWVLLQDKGLVTADGQYVSFTHAGGVVAAGTQFTLQPRPAMLGTLASLGGTPTPTAAPRGTPRPLAIDPGDVARLERTLVLAPTRDLTATVFALTAVAIGAQRGAGDQPTATRDISGVLSVLTMTAGVPLTRAAQTAVAQTRATQTAVAQASAGSRQQVADLLADYAVFTCSARQVFAGQPCLGSDGQLTTCAVGASVQCTATLPARVVRQCREDPTPHCADILTFHGCVDSRCFDEGSVSQAFGSHSAYACTFLVAGRAGVADRLDAVAGTAACNGTAGA